MPIFDGDTLTITLDSGVTEVDVERDLYSGWKRWLLSGTTGENRRYPQAFRVVGGDNLTPGIKAGAYFFIQNDKGWRIRPAEEDATILVTGNLAPEDSGIDILIPTIGDFSVLVAGLQPITQSVGDILLQGQTAEYQGIIAVDFLNGTSGTEYPIGLKSNPVDNVTDAFLIAERIKSNTFEISNGTFSLDRNTISYTYIGGGGQGAVNVNGYNVGGSKFLGTALISTDFSGTTSGVRVVGSNIIDVSNFRGVAENCGIIGTITLQPQLCTFNNCFSIDTSGIPVIFDVQSGSTQLNVSSWSGTFELHNTINGFLGNVNINSGEVHFEPTCYGGEISLRGIGNIEDESTGLIINRNGFIEGEDVIQLRNFIYIDTVNGVSGTTENVGTINNPVNNIIDGYTLSVQRKTKAFKVKTDSNLVSPLVLDRNYSNYIFESIISPSTAFISLNGQVVNSCQFNNVAISGSCLGNIIAKDSVLSDVSGFVGVIDDCSLTGTLTPADYGETIMEDCFSITTNITPNLPTINMAAIVNRRIQLRNHGGGISVINMTTSQQKLLVDINKGTLTLNNSNTGGNFEVRGIGILDDTSAGTAVVSDNLIDPRHLENLYRLQGLDSANPMTVTKTARTAGDINLIISGDGENTATVTRT